MEYRHELKFLVSDITLEKLKYRLAPIMEIDGNQVEDFYTIRSLYFDDLFDTCLNENLAGTDDRSKYRLRFYKGSLDYINLEKKYKLRGMTKKEQENIDKAWVEQLLENETIENRGELTTQLLAASCRAGMKPKCIVEYDRCAFVEPAGNVRITFDMNLRGSMDVDRFLDTDTDFTIPVLPPGWHILEVKYDEFLPRYILQLVDDNNLQRQSFSKYSCIRKELELL